MSVMKLFGEAVGFLAVVIGFLVFQQRDRQKILKVRLIGDILWITHFGLLGAFSGMAISMVAALRAIVFSRVRKENNRKGILWLLLFLLINVVSVSIAWNSPWSVCSLISSMLATIAFWQTSTNRIKLISLIVCASQITYAIAMGSYASSLNELITVTSILIFFIRNAKSKKLLKNENEETQGK